MTDDEKSERVDAPPHRPVVTVGWVFYRLLLPLVGAGLALVFGWGKDNVAPALILPLVYLLLGMLLTWHERPTAPELEADRKFDRLRRNWHALTLLALLVLMIFEAAVPLMASQEVTDPRAYAWVLGALYVPYALLAFCAQVYLVRAKRIIDRLVSG